MSETFFEMYFERHMRDIGSNVRTMGTTIATIIHIQKVDRRRDDEMNLLVMMPTGSAKAGEIRDHMMRRWKQNETANSDEVCGGRCIDNGTSVGIAFQNDNAGNTYGDGRRDGSRTIVKPQHCVSKVHSDDKGPHMHDSGTNGTHVMHHGVMAGGVVRSCGKRTDRGGLTTRVSMAANTARRSGSGGTVYVKATAIDGVYSGMEAAESALGPTGERSVKNRDMYGAVSSINPTTVVVWGADKEMVGCVEVYAG